MPESSLESLSNMASLAMAAITDSIEREEEDRHMDEDAKASPLPGGVQPQPLRAGTAENKRIGNFKERASRRRSLADSTDSPASFIGLVSTAYTSGQTDSLNKTLRMRRKSVASLVGNGDGQPDYSEEEKEHHKRIMLVKQTKELLTPSSLAIRMRQLNGIIRRKCSKALFKMSIRDDIIEKDDKDRNAQATVRRLTIMQTLLASIRTKRARGKAYLTLVLFSLFFALYLLSLSWKLSSGDARDMQNSIDSQMLTLLPKTGYLPDNEAFYLWFEYFISAVFKPPRCGNGECEPPEEYPATGRFGCKPDCGRITDVVKVSVKLEPNFGSLGGVPLNDIIVKSGTGIDKLFSFNVWSESRQAYILEKDSTNPSELFVIPDGIFRFELYQDNLKSASIVSDADLFQFAGIAPGTLPVPEIGDPEMSYGKGRDALMAATAVIKTVVQLCAGGRIPAKLCQELDVAKAADALLLSYGYTKGSLLIPNDSGNQRGVTMDEIRIDVPKCGFTQEALDASNINTCPEGVVPGRCRDGALLARKFLCESKFPFEVWRFGTGGDDEDPAGGDGPYERPDLGVLGRSIVPFNSIIGAVIVSQTRRKKIPCEEVPEGVAVLVGQFTCEVEDSETPYGSDPYFNPFSTLYEGKLPVRQFFSENEIKDISRGGTGDPFGFYPHQWGKAPANVSMNNYGQTKLFFDTSLLSWQAKKRAQFMRDGGFIDDLTSSVTVEMLIINPQHPSVGSLQIIFKWDTAGNIGWERSLIMTKLGTYAGAPSSVIAMWMTDAAFLVMLVYDCMKEIHLINISLRRERFNVYIKNVGSYLIWGHMLMLLGTYSAWTYITGQIRQTVLPENLVVLKGYNMGPRPFDTFPLQEKIVLDFIDKVRMLCWNGSLVWAFNCFCVFGFMMRTMTLLDFQPRLALITRVIRYAGKDLGHFMALFMFLLVSYGTGGVLLFGAKLSTFADLASAIQSLIFIFMGWLKNFVQLENVIASYRNRATTVVFYIYYWSWFVMTRLLLFNICAAIIVQAFGKLSKKNNLAKTFFGEFAEIAGTMTKEALSYVGKKPDFILDKDLSRAIDEQMASEKLSRTPVVVFAPEAQVIYRLRLPGGIQVDSPELSRLIEEDIADVNSKSVRRGLSALQAKSYTNPETQYIDGIEVHDSGTKKVHKSVQKLIRRYGTLYAEETDDKERMRFLKLENLMMSLTSLVNSSYFSRQVTDLLEDCSSIAANLMNSEEQETLRQHLLLQAAQNHISATIGDLVMNGSSANGAMKVTVHTGHNLPSLKAFGSSMLSVALYLVGPAPGMGGKGNQIVTAVGQTTSVSARSEANWAAQVIAFEAELWADAMLVAILIDDDERVALGASLVDLEELPLGESDVEIWFPLAPIVIESETTFSRLTSAVSNAVSHHSVEGPEIKVNILFVPKSMEIAGKYCEKGMAIMRRIRPEAQQDEMQKSLNWLTCRLSLVDILTRDLSTMTEETLANQELATGALIMKGLKRSEIAIGALERMMGGKAKNLKKSSGWINIERKNVVTGTQALGRFARALSGGEISTIWPDDQGNIEDSSKPKELSAGQKGWAALRGYSLQEVQVAAVQPVTPYIRTRLSSINSQPSSDRSWHGLTRGLPGLSTAEKFKKKGGFQGMGQSMKSFKSFKFPAIKSLMSPQSSTKNLNVPLHLEEMQETTGKKVGWGGTINLKRKDPLKPNKRAMEGVAKVGARGVGWGAVKSALKGGSILQKQYQASMPLQDVQAPQQQELQDSAGSHCREQVITATADVILGPVERRRSLLTRTNSKRDPPLSPILSPKLISVPSPELLDKSRTGTPKTGSPHLISKGSPDWKASMIGSFLGVRRPSEETCNEVKEGGLKSSGEEMC